MSIQANLEKIREIQYLALSKEQYPGSKLREWFVDKPIEAPDAWLIPCSHVFHPPVTESQILTLVSNLGQDLPIQLQDLLKFTDGAELFNLHYKPGEFDYWIARYNILTCSNLLRVNQELFDIFLTYAEYDDKYREVEKLNYLAFCDIGDGNYLAFSSEGADIGTIFFLNHDYGFYPYRDESTKDVYIPMANSLDEWLEQLIQTNGQKGTGGIFVPL